MYRVGSYHVCIEGGGGGWTCQYRVEGAGHVCIEWGVGHVCIEWGGGELDMSI